MPVETPQPANILKYVKPGRTCHLFITHVENTEVTVLNNVIVAIDGMDVGGYGLRYSTYLKMHPYERELARLTARSYTLHERVVAQRIQTGIIFPMLQKHLFPQAPGFPIT